MNITMDRKLEDFEFWGGAKPFAAALTSEELRQIEAILDDQYPDGISETELNDIFCYDDDTIADWLGLKSAEYILCRTDAVYLLGEAKDLLEQAREENFAPEFTFDYVAKFRETHGEMSREEFIESGWKQYVAELNGDTLEDVEDYADNYEDTLDYLRLELMDDEISSAILSLAAFKKEHETWQRPVDVHMHDGESLAHFRDRLTDKIEDIYDILDRTGRDFAEILIDDLNKCDDLAMDYREQEEPDR